MAGNPLQEVPVPRGRFRREGDDERGTGIFPECLQQERQEKVGYGFIVPDHAAVACWYLHGAPVAEGTPQPPGGEGSIGSPPADHLLTEPHGLPVPVFHEGGDGMDRQAAREIP
jgi:hypothetical protein